MNVLLADLVLLIHVGFIAFVVFGQVLVMWGAHRKWNWVYHLQFRIIHVVAILVVAVQAWIGMWCPLTVWEEALRRSAGEEGYRAGLIADLVHALIYYDAPQWVFTALYTFFALLVIAYWFIANPVSKTKNQFDKKGSGVPGRS